MRRVFVGLAGCGKTIVACENFDGSHVCHNRRTLPQVQYVLNPRMAVSLGYIYERGLADGRRNMPFDDEVSYRLHAVSAGTDLMLIESLSLHLGDIYRRKDLPVS